MRDDHYRAFAHLSDDEVRLVIAQARAGLPERGLLALHGALAQVSSRLRNLMGPNPSPILPQRLLRDMETLTMLHIAERDPDKVEEQVRDDLVSKVRRLEDGEDVNDAMDVVGGLQQVMDSALGLSYIANLPSLDTWTDAELALARHMVESAFRHCRETTSQKNTPTDLATLRPGTFWSLWQQPWVGGILTIRDVLAVRERGDTFWVIDNILYSFGPPRFKRLTAEDFMFKGDEHSTNLHPRLGYFYAYPPNPQRCDEYRQLERDGQLDRLLDAHAVSGSGSDLWVKLSPALVGLAYGWAAQTLRDGGSRWWSDPPGGAPPWMQLVEEYPERFPASTFDEVVLRIWAAEPA
jgi:hypothetical protein